MPINKKKQPKLNSQTTTSGASTHPLQLMRTLIGCSGSSKRMARRVVTAQEKRKRMRNDTTIKIDGINHFSVESIKTVVFTIFKRKNMVI